MDESHQEICALEERWMAAWRQRDRGVLLDLMDEDFQLIVSARPDERFQRSEWLNQALGPYVCRALEFIAPQVRTIGDLAAFSAIARQEASINGVDRSGDFFVTDLWRRSADGWRVVARYSSQPEEAGEGSGAMRVTAD